MITQLLDRIRYLELELASLALRAAEYREALENIKKGYRELQLVRDKPTGAINGVTEGPAEYAGRRLGEIDGTAETQGTQQKQ